ncbi:MAG: DNA-directed RNA polymerase subunit D [Nitrososphaerota archaeon]|nr:DNA-directed RNA polymerase subunit D [Candidatus Bathyarchaeota archaeon]MDW8048778.1 DNA-directed RNA polymerase subunit D [Nitrososphaerota archaeon]
MSFRIMSRTESSMTFLVEGVSAPLANTLRRIMHSEVPTMAIDDVVVIENSSVLHDEILALRLGLIPLKTDLDAYNLPEECECRSELGCKLCRVILTLDVQAEGSVRTVYSGDLVSEDPRIIPVSDRIPIVKLAPGQRIRLEAYAKLGRGKDHAKWQPVSACVYRHVPIVEIDGKVCDACGACVQVCPKKVLKKYGNSVEVADLMSCTLCEDCVRACKKDPSAIKVMKKEDSFIFYIEGTGSLPIERILTEGLKIYEKKFSEFVKKLMEIQNEPQEAVEEH